MIKNKIQKLIEQSPADGKEIVMILAEELDKTNNQIIELKKRLPPKIKYDKKNKK